MSSVKLCVLWSLLANLAAHLNYSISSNNSTTAWWGEFVQMEGVWWFWSHPRRQARMRNRTITFQSIFCCDAKRSYGRHATGSDYKIPERKHIQSFQAESVNKSNRGPHQRAAICWWLHDELSYSTGSATTKLMTKFSNAAKSYGLQISITKTEVMYQPAPG